MKSYLKVARVEALLGLLTGASALLVLRLAGQLWPRAAEMARNAFTIHLSALVAAVPHFWLLAALIAVSLLLKSWSWIVSLLRRMTRSWFAGLVTGIFPLWALLSFVLLVRVDHWRSWHLLAFAGLGVLPALVQGVIVRIRSARTIDPTIRIPDPISIPEEPMQSGEIEFDLPVTAWSQDYLNRGPFVASLAEAILKDGAPVIAVTGKLGDGKSSALNLLGVSLRERGDVIVVSFSSWLPGDEQTLVLSLFETIAEHARSQYWVPGLTGELRKFARMLLGTVPKFGETLRTLLEEPSQTSQLRALKRLLAKLPVRIVVLIDEIDRMDSKEVHALLKAIRGVVDLPNLTYVCAFYRKSLIRLIGEQDSAYGRLYVEKFFPVQFLVPPADRELLGKFFDQKMDGLSERFGLFPTQQDRKVFDEAVLPIWHTCMKSYLGNFRRMILFFNAFEVSLKQVSKEVNPFDMMILQLVKMMSEETYEFIYENPAVFYDPGWRIALWMERLSVNDEEERVIRKGRLDGLFNSLEASDRERIKELLKAVFPSVGQYARGDRQGLQARSPERADRERRIYHPDYFPRYFIHQVPLGAFGIAALNRFIEDMNSKADAEQAAGLLKRTLVQLADNPWKRWSFLDALAAEADRIGLIQSERIPVCIAEISDSLENDVLGLGEWGRARALLFAVAKRFAGTSKLQDVLVEAIRQAKSDSFAADLLRFCTTMREKNKIVADWTGVDEAALRAAFCERMRIKYTPSANRGFSYIGPDLSAFYLWVTVDDDLGKAQEVAFFRERFARDTAERARFLGWVLPMNAVYEGDPLDAVEKLFPVGDLFESVRPVPEDVWPEAHRASVRRFVELVEIRRQGQP